MASRFNTKATDVTKTTNLAGGQAYKLDAEMSLYTSICCATLSNNYYQSADSFMKALRKLLKDVDPEFTKKLMVYAREDMYLRTIPVVLAVELASMGEIDSKTVERIIKRPDEITELLACYQARNEKNTKNINGQNKKLRKLSKALQRAIKNIFESGKFDEYQLAKYNRATDVKLRDAVFLSHPKFDTSVACEECNHEFKIPTFKEEKNSRGNEEFTKLDYGNFILETKCPKCGSDKLLGNGILLNKLVMGSLTTPYTWETELSELGKETFTSEKKREDAFKAKWEELIDSKKVGYMALLRNLRNIITADVSSEHINKVAEYISNENAVAKSKQFPFRFLAAHDAISDSASPEAQVLSNALETALKHAVEHNIDGFDKNTRVCIACDVSGSMQTPISKNSSIQLYDIGLLLGMMLKQKCNRVVTGIFGDIYKNFRLPNGSILGAVEQLRSHEGEVGYSTNGFLVVRNLIETKTVVDKIMIFCDCQLWDSTGSGFSNRKNTLSGEFAKYRKEINPDAQIYVFNLAAYLNYYGESSRATVPLDIRSPGVAVISGWSDKIFNVLNKIENGGEALDAIKSIKI